METPRKLLDIPNHVLIHILNFLDPTDIPELALTNKKLHYLVETNLRRMPKHDVQRFIFDCFKECVQFSYIQSDATETHVKDWIYPFDFPELLRISRRMKLKEFGRVEIIEATLSNQYFSTVLKFLEIIIKCGWPRYRQKIQFAFEMSSCEFINVDLAQMVGFIGKIIDFGCQNLEMVHISLNEFEKINNVIKQSKITELSDFGIQFCDANSNNKQVLEFFSQSFHGDEIQMNSITATMPLSLWENFFSKFDFLFQIPVLILHLKLVFPNNQDLKNVLSNLRFNIDQKYQQLANQLKIYYKEDTTYYVAKLF